MTTGIRKNGEICWINMLTPEPAEAREFFGKLLGWTYADIGMGHMVQVAGRSIGGLFDVVSPQTPKGTPPLIGVMVKVENADAVGARVVALGGKARPAFDIGDSGRLAVCHDPAGAEFDAWQPKSLLGTDVDSLEHGAPGWFDVMTTDLDRAATFYSDLLGWTPVATTSGGVRVTTFQQDGEDVAGIRPCTAFGPEPHWATYFTVKDIDASVREAIRLGGTLRSPMSEAGAARFAGIESPQGVGFYLMEGRRVLR
jgi:predicted enzyme related to lactoylglutathione lyase